MTFTIRRVTAINRGRKNAENVLTSPASVSSGVRAHEGRQFMNMDPLSSGDEVYDGRMVE